MTQAEFIEITSEIERFYSTDKEDKKYTSEQIKIMYEELKKIHKERYRQIAREVYKTLKFMPKLADLVEINNTLPKIQEDIQEKVECKKCDGTGMVAYFKEIKDGNITRKYLFGARCTCANGAVLSKKIPSIAEVGVYDE